MKQISDKNSEGRENNDLQDFIPEDKEWVKFRNRVLLVLALGALLLLKYFKLI